MRKANVKVIQSCLILCDPIDYTVHGILQARILEWVAFPFSRGFSQPRSPTLQVDSLPAEPQGKPMNTGVGSLSLLQRIFPTQESSRGPLHGRRILYQLSCEGRGDKPSAKPAGQSVAGALGTSRAGKEGCESGGGHAVKTGCSRMVSMRRGSSRPRKQTWVSCFAGEFFTN